MYRVNSSQQLEALEPDGQRGRGRFIYILMRYDEVFGKDGFLVPIAKDVRLPLHTFLAPDASLLSKPSQVI